MKAYGKKRQDMAESPLLAKYSRRGRKPCRKKDKGRKARERQYFQVKQNQF